VGGRRQGPLPPGRLRPLRDLLRLLLLEQKVVDDFSDVVVGAIGEAPLRQLVNVGRTAADQAGPGVEIMN
jgi:hypothetical protein